MKAAAVLPQQHVIAGYWMRRYGWKIGDTLKACGLAPTRATGKLHGGSGAMVSVPGDVLSVSCFS